MVAIARHRDRPSHRHANLPAPNSRAAYLSRRCGAIDGEPTQDAPRWRSQRLFDVEGAPSHTAGTVHRVTLLDDLALGHEVERDSAEELVDLARVVGALRKASFAVGAIELLHTDGVHQEPIVAWVEEPDVGPYVERWETLFRMTVD